MLVAKKINQKKFMALTAIGLIMASGIAYFIYKNYTLTHIDYSEQTIANRETVVLKKENTNSTIKTGAETIDESANMPSEHDFINKNKWRSLIKTDYSLPYKIITGNNNPYQLEKK